MDKTWVLGIAAQTLPYPSESMQPEFYIQTSTSKQTTALDIQPRRFILGLISVKSVSPPLFQLMPGLGISSCPYSAYVLLTAR